MTDLRVIPAYIWAFIALVMGIGAGGLFPGFLAPVADWTRSLINLIILFVPLLIFAALSPAIATLIRRGLAGRMGGAVILWYAATSTLAALVGMLIASVIFRVPLTTEAVGAIEQGMVLLGELREGTGVSYPLLAVIGAVLVGILGVRIEPLYRILSTVERGIHAVGATIGFAMIPLILAFGIMIGVTFGARLGMSHYGTMIVYTMLLSLAWWLFYIFVLLRYLGGVRSVRPLLTKYFIPTGLFAAGTCSSLATLPVNISNLKDYGVRDEVADFVLPVGAVMNMDASALQHMAYAPFVTMFLFDLEMSWAMMAMAWPFIVLYTLASPGLPAGMGTSLWAAVLFASFLGLEDPVQATFVGTWVALSGGIPDMFRTATNCTADGFVGVIFHNNFEKFRPRGMGRGEELGDALLGTAEEVVGRKG